MKNLSGLTFRYLKHNGARTAMTITAVALSTILIYAVFCSGMSMTKSSQRMDYYAWGGYDVSYSVPTSDLFTYREKLKNDGISSMWSLTSFEDWGTQIEDNIYIRPKYSLNSVYVDDFSALAVPLHISIGTFPKNENQVVIESYPDVHVGEDYTIGSHTEYVDGDPYEISKRLDELSQLDDDYKSADEYEARHLKITPVKGKVVGLYDSQYGNYSDTSYIMGETYNRRDIAMSATYIWSKLPSTEEGVEALGNGLEAINSVYISFASKKNIPEQAKAIAQKMRWEDYSLEQHSNELYTATAETENLDAATSRAFQYITAFFFAIIVLFVIRNSFNISVNEREKDYGMLRCIGLTRKQIMSMIILEAFIIAISGALIGIVLSQLIVTVIFRLVCMAPSILQTMLMDYNFKFSAKVPAEAMVHADFSVEAVVSTAIYILVITSIATVSPIDKMFHISPVSAMTERDTIKTHLKKSQKKIEKLGKKQEKRGRLLNKLFGVEVGYAYKNLMRTKGRFLITTITLTLGISVLIFSGSMLKTVMTTMLNFMGKYQERVSLDDVSGMEGLASDLEVEGYSARCDCYLKLVDWPMGADGGWKDKKEGPNYYLGLNRRLYDEFFSNKTVREDVQKQIDQDKDLIPVFYAQTPLAEKKVKVGDIIAQYYLSKKLIVAGVLPENETNQLIKDLEGQGNLAYAYGSSLNAIYIFNYSDTPGLYDEKSALDVDKLINSSKSERIEVERYQYVTGNILVEMDIQSTKKVEDFEEYLNSRGLSASGMGAIAATVEVFRILIIIVVVFILVILIINSANTQRANLMVREKEITLLREIGMTERQKNRMLYTEGIFSSILALILGTGIGLFLLKVSAGLFNLAGTFVEDAGEVAIIYRFDFLALIIAAIVLFASSYITTNLNMRGVERK